MVRCLVTLKVGSVNMVINGTVRFKVFNSHKVWLHNLYAYAVISNFNGTCVF